MKLYSVTDGPPSIATRMTLKALNIQYELIEVDYVAGEHRTEKYAKMNPQKEIPVLDDDGFILSESVAIMQYLCDKYSPDSPLYPKDPKQRALVNHRLCFGIGFYYNTIRQYVIAPLFFDYERTPAGLKQYERTMEAFEAYLKNSGTKYGAGNHLTIADFLLVAATLPLEAADFSLDKYPLIKKWYNNFKTENPDLWKIAEAGMSELAKLSKNPPDLSGIPNPIHPIKKLNK